MMLSEKKREKTKLFIRTWLTLTMISGMTMTCYAGSYSENAVKWGLDELSWIILIVAISLAAAAAVKRSTGAIITSILIGGILFFLCKNPTVIGEVGDKLGSKIFK